MRRSETTHQTIDLLKTYFSKIQIADKDRDLDRDPYTSAAWSGNAFSTSTGTINWVTDFGLPEIPKMVWLYVNVRDSASAGASYRIHLKAKSTTTNPSISVWADRALSDAMTAMHGPVAVADDGTTYYDIVASGANTFDVWIRVTAWVK